MKENFDKYCDFMIDELEGGYEDDPQDRGGETKYGISKRAHPTLDIKNLTIDHAKTIYRSDYWYINGCDNYAFPMDILVFDTAVNMGNSVAMDLLNRTGSPEEFIIKRIAKYATFKQFNVYGKGWINRVMKVYDFIRKEVT